MGCQVLGIRKSEFVANTHFLFMKVFEIPQVTLDILVKIKKNTILLFGFLERWRMFAFRSDSSKTKSEAHMD